MSRPGVQLYTVRDVDEPFPTLVERVADLGYEGVEFAYRVGEEDPENVREALSAHDLEALGAHVPIDRLENETETVVEEYRALGCDRLVVPHLGEEHFVDREAVEETADRLSALGNRLRDHDASLLYHNHAHEFAEIEGESALERLVEESDASLGIELDVGLATWAGADPLPFLAAHADRIPLVHLTDSIPGDPDGQHVELGDGEVDLDGVLSAARKAEVEWLVFERGTSDEQLRTLQRGASVLERLLGEDR